MEAHFYTAVEIVAAVYLLHKVWKALFRERLFGLWEWMLSTAEQRAAESPEAPPPASVLGRTNKVVLEDPRSALPEPVGSIDLEPTGFIGQDEPVEPEEIEGSEAPCIPSDDELEDAPAPDPNELSAGLSYEEISQAADVLVNGTKDEAQRLKAAKTLYDLQNTQLYDFIAGEISRETEIKNLFHDCLDVEGFPLKHSDSVAGFEMGRYV